MRKPLLASLVVLVLGQLLGAASRPNLVFILADDMGYGDVHALNPRSKIATPHLDRLAREGMAFTDAHSPSAVCTPTRYGLLTGRYCWRTRLKRGVLGGYSPPLIDADRPTFATMLQQHGYRTAAVGKWHLGMSMPFQSEDADASTWQGDPGIAFSGRILDSPVQRGFDHYFGVSASLDMAPYVFIRNDGFASLPTLQQSPVPFPHFIRSGPRAADFVVEEVLDRLTDEAVKWLRSAAGNDPPFCLYFPLTAPHKPTQPHARFRGRTGLGEYGDFVMQVDATVGRVLQAIDECGIAENTMVVYTSDNGSYMFRSEREEADADHVTDASRQAYFADHHRANGPFRGTKADIWEAGHHVPLLVRWPQLVSPATRCDATVCHTDWYATFAELVGASLASNEAEDSCSLLAMLQSKSDRRPAPVIHHSGGGMFAIRQSQWKLVLGNGSGGRERPRGRPFAKPYQLFDLSTDIAEQNDLAAQYPQVVARLVEQFEQIRDSGRSVSR